MQNVQGNKKQTHTTLKGLALCLYFLTHFIRRTEGTEVGRLLQI